MGKTTTEKEPDRLLRAKDAAALLGISVDSLLRGECGTKNLNRIQLAPRVIRWSHDDVQALIASLKREALEQETPRLTHNATI